MHDQVMHIIEVKGVTSGGVGLGSISNGKLRSHTPDMGLRRPTIVEVVFAHLLRAWIVIARNGAPQEINDLLLDLLGVLFGEILVGCISEEIGEDEGEVLAVIDCHDSLPLSVRTGGNPQPPDSGEVQIQPKRGGGACGVNPHLSSLG